MFGPRTFRRSRAAWAPLGAVGLRDLIAAVIWAAVLVATQLQSFPRRANAATRAPARSAGLRPPGGALLHRPRPRHRRRHLDALLRPSVEQSAPAAACFVPYASEAMLTRHLPAELDRRSASLTSTSPSNWPSDKRSSSRGSHRASWIPVGVLRRTRRSGRESSDAGRGHSAASPRIADYGLLGDCDGAALARRNGSIGWWRPPRCDAHRRPCARADASASNHETWHTGVVGRRCTACPRNA